MLHLSWNDAIETRQFVASLHKMTPLSIKLVTPNLVVTTNVSYSGGGSLSGLSIGPETGYSDKNTGIVSQIWTELLRYTAFQSRRSLPPGQVTPH